MVGRRGAPPNGYPFDIAAFRIDRDGAGAGGLPERLVDPQVPDPSQARNAGSPRRFRLEMHHMAGTINGRVFDMTDVAEDEIVRAGSLEWWEFANVGRGMPMPHPMHIHGVQFRIIERLGNREYPHLDDGWKDTVLVMPGERVRVLVRFGGFSGLCLYHCHNLEHYDRGMMRNYYVLPVENPDSARA